MLDVNQEKGEATAIIKATTGGYPATLDISSAALAKIRALRDGESVSLDDPQFVNASRSGRYVFIRESNGRFYDVDVYDL